jgi:hypothetical protein
MTWSPQSQDMSSIVNLWKMMKDMFCTGMKLSASTQAIIDAWESIDIKDINKLILTIPRRIDELNKKHGWSTHY